ncbi:DUF927 domain-containing protein [Desulfocurvibacter africanus]|uniref:DUF927 domain-containing protein n=1 Tax=Desulfocurvibacter africanus TaxID=873 RepID=UPI0003F6612D|nr:DUF927 domain-containing protein [Desulfocurvibacter africanus]
MSDITTDFRRCMENAGLAPGEEIISDGNLHRCGTADKPVSKNGWYVLHADIPASGAYGDWRTGESGTWTAKADRDLSPAERERIKTRIKTDRKAREAEEVRRHAEAAERARCILESAEPATDGHPYLKRKGVPAHSGAKLARDGRLVIPVLGPDGKPQSVQFIDADGGKMFLAGGKTAGGYFAIRGADGPLYICEGYATAASIHVVTDGTVLAAFNCGNLKAVAQVARNRYPERQIILCADDDHATQGNPGLTKSREAASAVGGLMAVPTFSESANRGTDFNDLHQAEGPEVVRRCLVDAKPLDTSDMSDNAYSPNGKGLSDTGNGQPDTSDKAASVAVPKGFLNNEAGLFRLEEDQEGAVQQVWLGPCLDVLGMTRDTDGAAWGLYVQWRDPDGHVHRWAMPLSMLSRDDSGWHSSLADGGWTGAPGKKARQGVATYLATSRPKDRVRCVNRTGWQNGLFVLPDSAVGNSSELVVLQREGAEGIYRTGGTLEGWQTTIGTWATGNSRLVLAVCTAFAAALLEIAGQESGGFNFVGGSSTGKSTALHAAGSACGGGGIGGYVRNWRATANGLEGLAAMHCDSLLCLDELGQADARAVSEAAYMLANGSGKSRASRDGSHRMPATWRTLVLSSGEIGLAAKIAEETGRSIKAGQEVRLVDVQADAGKGLGLFEDLHGHASPTLFADSIKRAAVTHYGHAFRAFVARMASEMDQVRTGVLEAIPAFVDGACPADADGQVRRVAARFALCAVAGEMAAEWGILPWRAGEALEAAKRCLDEWIAGRGGAGASEDRAILTVVRLFLEQHGAARFQDLDEEGKANAEKCINRAGFRRKTPGGHEFIFLPSVFDAEVLRGHDVNRAAKVLQRAGWLRTNERGLRARVQLPGLGRQRCYVVALPDGQEG